VLRAQKIKMRCLAGIEWKNRSTFIINSLSFVNDW
jgi:hypothetical protein